MESSPKHPSRYEPVQSRGRRTRRQVLEAARKVFIRRGYDAARVEEITRIGQVGYGTFYKYFRNKQDVLDALMTEVYIELSDDKFPSQLDPSCFEDQVRNGVIKYLQACYKNRKILLAVQSACMASSQICKIRTELREKNVLWMIRELEKIGVKGRRVQGNLEILSRAMIQILECAALDWITHHRHFNIQDVSETLCEIWLRALLYGHPNGAMAGAT